MSTAALRTSNIRYLDRYVQSRPGIRPSVIKLILVNKDLEPTEFRIKERITTIGRSSDNHLVLKGSRVSRYHVSIEQTARGFVLNDLGSRNGTYVNNKPVKTHRLEIGDKVRVGENFLFVDEADAKREDAMAFLLERLEDSEKKFLQAGLEFLKIEKKDVLLGEVFKTLVWASVIVIPLIVVLGVLLGMWRMAEVFAFIKGFIGKIFGSGGA